MELTNYFFLVYLLVASAVAYPWNHARHHQAWTMESVHSSAIGTGVQSLCTSIVGEQVGSAKVTAVHVCDQGEPNVCYYSALDRCCGVQSALELSGGSTVVVGGNSVPVKFFKTGGYDTEIEPGVCVHFPIAGGVDRCSIPSVEGRKCTPKCIEPPQICVNNSVGGNSCGETTCECQPEYQPPTCCDCKEGNFFKTPEGKCLKLCINNCIKPNGQFGCLPGECETGFKEPTCCECDDGFLETPTNKCCPVGTIEENGVCVSFCSPKCDVMYSNPALGCKQCSEGFKEPLCCDCVDGYRKTQSGQCCPENTIEINGICTSICQQNVENVETDCYNSEQCTKCKNNFAPPTCCECAGGYQKTSSGQCCPEDQIEVKGKCQSFCNGDCNQLFPDKTLGCESCKFGFKEPQCCECKDGYRKTQSGQCCPENTIEISGTCTPICKKNVENVETDCYDSERCTKCKNNYAPPTCCDCADGYRKTQSGQCCPENTIEISGTCTPICEKNVENVKTDCYGSEQCTKCENNYAPPTCCGCSEGFDKVGEECVPQITCSDKQDIYFVLDYGNGFAVKNLYPAGYVLMQLTSAIRNNSGSTVSGVVYPTKFTYPQGHMFMTPDQSCKEAILNIEKMMGLYYIEGYDMPSSAKAFKIVYDDISNKYKSGPTDKAIAVITITGDFSETDTLKPLQDHIKGIIKINPSTKFISAGLKTNGMVKESKLKNELDVLANKMKMNQIYVENTEGIDTLLSKLVDLMKSNGIICEDQASKIKITGFSSDVNYKKYISCKDALQNLFKPSSGTESDKKASKKKALAMTPTSSNFPPECQTWLCPNAKIQREMKSEIEAEILSAVEEILESHAVNYDEHEAEIARDSGRGSEQRFSSKY